MVYYFNRQEMKNYNIANSPKHKCLFIAILLLCALNINAQTETDTLDISIKTEVDTIPALPPLSLETFRIDTVFSNRIYTDNFKLVPSKVNIYDLPYSAKANYPNYKRLAPEAAQSDLQ